MRAGYRKRENGSRSASIGGQAIVSRFKQAGARCGIWRALKKARPLKRRALKKMEYMKMELIDIGVNLAHRTFASDIRDVIKRGINAGVGTMIVTGTSLAASKEAAELAARHPQALYSTAGVHPHDARHSSKETIAALRSLAARPEVVAIGECGLDFNRDFSPRPLQEKCFEAQVELACELKMPLFLHERDAHSRFVGILRHHREFIKAAVVHCFTGGAEELKAYLDLGFHIGVTGWICDERRGVGLREIIKRIPLDRLMLETDAPFLTPRNSPLIRKQSRNEPAFLIYVLKTVAESLGISDIDLAAATTQTARKFFKLIT